MRYGIWKETLKMRMISFYDFTDFVGSAGQ